MRKKYVEFLSDAWQQVHLPRKTGAPTVVSLFAGCGGSSLGYQIAGFSELLAVEWDAHAVEHLKLNFPSMRVWHGDIANLSVEECLDITKMAAGELSLLDGSPPCQGFSTTGKRDDNDPRNMLFKEYVRLLRGLRPRAFVMENVTGLIKGKMKLVFSEIFKELRESGYVVQVAVMKASHYGVPQARERVIFLGARSDLNIVPTFPEPLPYIVSAANALYGADTSGTKELSDSGKALWRETFPGKNASDSMKIQSYWNTIKLHPDKPSPTLCKTNTGASFFHWRFPRSVSIGEAKRLQSFPDEYNFFGSFTEQWARIGNSVPPLLMTAIAKHLRSINGLL